MTFNEELTIATVGSLIGSVVGALVGALAAWFFSKRLFENESKAKEDGERRARALDRRLTETKLVEAWVRAIGADFRSIQMVISWLDLATSKVALPLPRDDWPYARQTTALGSPLLIGPLRGPCAVAERALWDLHDAVDKIVDEHREDSAPVNLEKIHPLREECMDTWHALFDALEVELNKLTLGDA